jgi:hypothetical protein
MSLGGEDSKLIARMGVLALVRQGNCLKLYQLYTIGFELTVRSCEEQKITEVLSFHHQGNNTLYKPSLSLHRCCVPITESDTLRQTLSCHLIKPT